MKMSMSQYIKTFIFKQKCLPYCISSRIKYKLKEYRDDKLGLNRNIDDLYKLKARVYSFDIFDTVVTRITATPQGIFQLIQNKINCRNIAICEDLKTDFRKWRMKAEEHLYKNLKKEGYTLSDIYTVLGERFSLSDEQCEVLMDIEVETEHESIKAVPQIVEMIKYLHLHNQRVIFITDMYLPKEVIKKILVDCGAFKNGDKLYVSNEIKKEKRTKELFRYVLKQESCRAKEMIHVGDNYYADVKNAKDLGIKPIYFKGAQLNRYEEILLKQNGTFVERNDLLREDIVGSSRIARLNLPLKLQRSITLHHLGTNIVGPVLTSYVNWVLREAKKSQVKRLYFLARDGQILYEIAKRLNETLKFDIECRYLYCSRQAMFLPSIQAITDHELEWILMKTPVITLRIICERTGLSDKLLSKELQKRIKKEISIDSVLNEKNVLILSEILSETNISNEILNIAIEQRQLILEYLKDEEVFDGTKYALVDLGWKGSIQDSISKIIQLSRHDLENNLMGYYFGLITKSKQNNVEKIGYFTASDGTDSVWPIKENIRYMMELFTTGDEGITLGYSRKSNGKIIPRLKESRNEDAIHWGLEYLRCGIFDFIKLFPKNYYCQTDVLDSAAFKRSLSEVLSILITRPTKQEALVLGDYRLKAGQAETYATQFAPALNMINALRYALEEDERKITNWIQGSYLRSDLFTKVLIRLAPIIGRFKKKVNKSGFLKLNFIKENKIYFKDKLL